MLNNRNYHCCIYFAFRVTGSDVEPNQKST